MDSKVVYFLQGLFRDALSLNFVYLVPPYCDFSSIDNHLREGLKDSAALYDAFLSRIKAFEMASSTPSATGIFSTISSFGPMRTARSFSPSAPTWSTKWTMP